MTRLLVFLRRHVLPPVVCMAAAWALMKTPLLQRVENMTRDERTRVGLGSRVPTDQLALLSIDETSIREKGRWPWPRDSHSDLMNLLSRAKPAVVTWDILFTEDTDADDAFARACAKNRAVVLGAGCVSDVGDGIVPSDAANAGVRLQPIKRISGDIAPIPSAPAMVVPAGKLANAAEAAFVDTQPDFDGVVRRAPLLIRVGQTVYPSLSLQTLLAYWGATTDNVSVELGSSVVIDAPLARRRVPIDAAGVYTINYRHDRSGFVEYPYAATSQALRERFADRLPVRVPALTGRIVLIGQVADGLTDFGPTGIAPHTPLVLVHANVIENILLEDYVRPVAEAYVWLGALVLGVLGLARFSERRPLEQAVFSLGVPVAFVVAATCAWINGSQLVPIFGPLLGFGALQVWMVGRRMIAELRAKEQIKGMFGTYVSPELVTRLVAAGKPPELGGHEEEVTAYFSDIQEFSRFSELLPPARLVELMNEYLSACTEILQSEGGTLDKYIGDMIVGMFGAPVPLPDHAYRACRTAIRSQERLAELRLKWAAEGRWPALVGHMRSRVGLNSGLCVVGNVGSATRFNYTMMGDNVNLASRMESGAKTWGTYTMCTEATRLQCEASAPGRVLFRPLGRIRVKGRSAAVPIFEVAGLRDESEARIAECIGTFSEALERYYARDWDGAEQRFRRAADLEMLMPGRDAGVGSNPSLIYLDLVQRFRREPPPADWDGVHLMREK